MGSRSPRTPWITPTSRGIAVLGDQPAGQLETWLENLTGHSVVDFAFRRSIQHVGDCALQATGYDTAVTELPGTVHSRGDRYLWTRERAYGGESLADFVNNLGRRAVGRRRLYDHHA